MQLLPACLLVSGSQSQAWRPYQLAPFVIIPCKFGVGNRLANNRAMVLPLSRQGSVSISTLYVQRGLLKLLSPLYSQKLPCRYVCTNASIDQRDTRLRRKRGRIQSMGRGSGGGVKVCNCNTQTLASKGKVYSKYSN